MKNQLKLNESCNIDERSAREIVIFALFGFFTQQNRAVHTENMHLYRKDRQWIAVKHSGHKVSRGEQIDEDIFRYNNKIEILSSTSSLLTTSFLLGTISPSLASISSLSLLPIEVNALNKDLCNKRSTIVSEHNYNLLSNNNSEKQGEAQYKTYVFDNFCAKYEKLICCLYFKGDLIARRFCKM